MEITLITRHCERRSDLVELLRRRAGYAFTRFGDLVRRLEVRLRDDNGPRGGEDLACLARLHLADGGLVLVEGRADSPERGITVIIERLAGALRRQHGRREERHLAWR